jgi:hypothetical protein
MARSGVAMMTVSVFQSQRRDRRVDGEVSGER